MCRKQPSQHLWLLAQLWLGTSEKPFSTRLHPAQLIFPAGIVPRGSVDSTSLESSESFLYFYIFSFFAGINNGQTSSGMHSHAHISTRSSTYAWPDLTGPYLTHLHDLMNPPPGLITHTCKYTHTLGLGRSHSPVPRTPAVVVLHRQASAEVPSIHVLKLTHTLIHSVPVGFAHEPTPTNIFFLLLIYF